MTPTSSYYSSPRRHAARGRSETRLLSVCAWHRGEGEVVSAKLVVCMHCARPALRPYPAARTPCATLQMGSGHLNLRCTYSGSICYAQVGSAYLNLREMLHHGAEWRQHELRFVAAEGGVLA